MKEKKYVPFKDPELEKSWRKTIEAMKKSGTRFYHKS